MKKQSTDGPGPVRPVRSGLRARGTFDSGVRLPTPIPGGRNGTAVTLLVNMFSGQIPAATVAALVLLAGCAGRAGPGPVAEAEHLLETDRAFAAASVRDGAARAFRSFLADEALQFSGGSEPVRGNRAIYEQMSAGMDSLTTLYWEPQEASVSRSADMGYTWGRYTVVREDHSGGSRRTAGTGMYVNVWRRQEDGSWKVVVDIGSSSSTGE